MMKTRAEMAEDAFSWFGSYCEHSPKVLSRECWMCFSKFLARRDEMVLEGAIKELSDSWDQGIACDILRDFKEKLK